MAMENSEKLWYVLRAIGGKEIKAKENLEAEVKRRGIENLVGEIIVPVEKIYLQRNGKKVLKERVLYSGYVFVECILNKETLAILPAVQYVLGFLTSEGNRVKNRPSSTNKPLPMRRDEVNRMIGRVDLVADDTREEEVPYVVGEKVKVIDGSFANFTGEIEEIKEDRKKLIVMIAIFGRKTPLELNYSQVVKDA